jgi:hypothetical protein
VQDISIMKRENTADIRKAAVDKEMKIEIKKTEAASAFNKTAERRLNIFTKSTIYIASSTSAPNDMTLVTLIK